MQCFARYEIQWVWNENQSFEKIETILSKKQDVYAFLKEKIQIQVERTRTDESSPKNTTLFFSILTETKDVVEAAYDLLEEYHIAHDSTVEPATIPDVPEDE